MIIRLPQRLPDPNIAWFDPKTGRPTDAYYQYMREMDEAVRRLIAASNDYDVRITELELP
jgi:hypothetical protein